MWKYSCLLAAPLAVALVLAPLMAQDQDKKKDNRKGRPAVASPFNLPREIQLTAEQTAKIDELKKKHADKLAELQKKAALTAEQREASQKAIAEARSAGKKGRELQAAGREAAKLSDEQSKAQDELTALNREIRAAITDLLTDDQKARLDNAKKKRGKNKDQ